MPRIRKKTSKRGTTRQREKIKHKVSEHRKKVKKQVRKDKAMGKPVKKRSEKNLGIPNNFPYKDQVLAEIAEQRRQAAAEKQRRKDERRAVTTGNNPNDLERSLTPEDIDIDDNDGQGFDGNMSLKPGLIPAGQDKNDSVKKQIAFVPDT